MTKAEYAAGHPVKQGQSYHNTGHIDNVRVMAYTSSLRRGLPKKDAVLMDQIAIVHDWDPGRDKGSKPRVPTTLQALADDFSGKKSLVPGHSESVLKTKFGWGTRELRIAVAIIQRTEYPFAGKHPNKAYGNQTPLDRYKGQLGGMPRADQVLALREGAMFAEYADKASFYSREPFSGSLKALVGLAREENKTNEEASKKSGKKFTSVKGMALFTPIFMGMVGNAEAFAMDQALAKSLGVKVDFPTREKFFSLMPKKWGQNYKATQLGFQRVAKALEAGKTIKQASALGTAVYAATMKQANAKPNARKPLRFPTLSRRKVTRLNSKQSASKKFKQRTVTKPRVRRR